MTAAEIEQARKDLAASTLTLPVFLETIRTRKNYAYKTTPWYRALMAVADPKTELDALLVLKAAQLEPPPPPPPPPPDPEPDPPPPPPPPIGSKGLGLLIYGGKMRTLAPDHSRYDYAVSNHLDIGTHRYSSALSISRVEWSGVDHITADAHDDWYLRLPDGAYAVNVGYPSSRIGDPGNQGYRDEWARQVIAKMAGPLNVRGVFVDDVVANPIGLISAMPTKYPDRVTWRAALTGFFASVVPKLNAAGLEVIVNSQNFIGGDVKSNVPTNDLDWYRQITPVVDGVNREYWQQESRVGGAMFYDEAVPQSYQAHYSLWLQLPELVQSLGKAFYCIFAPAAAPTAAVARYARGTFLLRWNGGKGGMVFAAGGYIPATDPWSAEWTRSLGAPAEAAVKVGVCWSRQFTAGRLIVNPTRTAQTVDGRSVPAQDALYL